MLRTVALLLVVVALTSCQTIHNLASKDNSGTSKKTPPKTTVRTGEVVFIDNISVTPGTSVTTSHTTKQSGPNKNNAVPTTYKEQNKNLSPAAIENADMLQLKYAIVFDATVEKLSNTVMLKSIDNWWGTRYCLGGNSKSCIDCSAFTLAIIKDVYDVNLPRTAQEQYNASQRIEMDELQEGDLVFFYTTGRRISHVGIYIMNNKFVHAAVSQGVTVSDLDDPYWKHRYRGAGRIAKPQSSMAGSSAAK